ncbi:MAG: hypothetical protein AAGB28_01585 [Pseudomonadota bacterium]
MPVDYDGLLSAEFETQSTQKCIGAALRAALRGFPSVNLGGNRDATRALLFPEARMLIQSIVHWHFECDESNEALRRGLQNIKPINTLLYRTSVHLTAQSTYSRNSHLAKKAIEEVMVSFASAADDEEALYDESSLLRPTRVAYDHALDLLLKNSIEDFQYWYDQVFDKPLWSERFEPAVPLEERVNFEEFFQGPSFTFWRKWRQGFIVGQPVDWGLQRRIALIDDSIWNAGPDTVANEIERIQARWKVEKALSDLNDSLSIQATARHGIGGNNPPESIHDERLSGPITLIWEATEELSTALEEENPARELIEAILGKLKAGLTDLLKWSALTVKLAVGTVAVIGAKKVTTAVVDAYVAKHPEKIEALIEALERWLPFLS